jgi:hypothetical protein
MSNESRLTTEQVRQITEAVKQAAVCADCRFDDAEAKAMHNLADALANGGLDNLRACIAFGGFIRAGQRAGWIAFCVGCVGAFLGVVWLGILAKIRGSL